MAINYAAKYSSKVDERFILGSLTNSAVNQEYEWAGVDTVNVYSIPTVALGDYSMTGTSRYGTPADLQDTEQTMKLTQDKSFTFVIDRRNYDDTMMTKEAGKALRREVDEVIIPTIDAYRIAKMVSGAGTTATPAAITKANAYDAFLDGQNALTENKVPLTGRLAYVSLNFFKSIKLDPSFIQASDMAQGMLLNGAIGMVDGVQIIPVPSTYLPANVEFVITHSVAIVAPVKLESYKIHDNPPGKQIA